MRFLQLQPQGVDRRKRSAIPTAKGAKSRQLKGICTAEGYRGVSATGAEGQCRAATPFRPCPSARHPDSRHKRAKPFFSPWIAFWDSGRLPWGLPKPCCCPNKLLAPSSINYALGGNCSRTGTRRGSKISWACFHFPPVSYFPRTADLSLAGKEPWLCCQGDVFLE